MNNERKVNKWDIIELVVLNVLGFGGLIGLAIASLIVTMMH